MKAVGIICEYNPFHNGHIYHIEQTKKMFPNHILILVLNGYFLQRGEVSCLSKEDKVNFALEYGCDIVLELPVVYGTQSADTFAEKSVEILHHFKVSDLVFGSERDNAELLMKMAQIQLTPNFSEQLKRHLGQGLNYPTSLSKAMNLDFLVQEPNDLLGISYAKAILKNHYNIKIHTILRTNQYHDTTSNQGIISASNIRQKFSNNESILEFVPTKVLDCYKKVDTHLLFSLLKSKILTDHHLEYYLTVDEGIENRLKKEILKAENLEEFIKRIKTKRYTYNRLHRMIIHILLGLTKEINETLELDYIHVLGFSTSGQNYLNKIKKNIIIPLKPKLSSTLYDFEKKAAFFYEILTNSQVQCFELLNKPIQK